VNVWRLTDLLIPSFQMRSARAKVMSIRWVGLQTSHNVGEVAHTDERGGPTSVGVFEVHRHDELLEHESQCTEGSADSVTLTKGRTERTAAFHADESEHVHRCAAADKHPEVSIYTATHPAGESE
jgi:hypothetical protein